MITTLELIKGFNASFNAMSETSSELDRVEIFKTQVLRLVQHAHDLETERDNALTQINITTTEFQQLYSDHDRLHRNYTLMEKENDALRNNVIQLMQDLNTAENTILQQQTEADSLRNRIVSLLQDLSAVEEKPIPFTGTETVICHYGYLTPFFDREHGEWIWKYNGDEEGAWVNGESRALNKSSKTFEGLYGVSLEDNDE